jgi:hypothetical protein
MTAENEQANFGFGSLARAPGNEGFGRKLCQILDKLGRARIEVFHRSGRIFAAKLLKGRADEI